MLLFHPCCPTWQAAADVTAREDLVSHLRRCDGAEDALLLWYCRLCTAYVVLLMMYCWFLMMTYCMCGTADGVLLRMYRWCGAVEDVLMDVVLMMDV